MTTPDFKYSQGKSPKGCGMWEYKKEAAMTMPPFKSQAELEAKHPITVTWGAGPAELGREYFDNKEQVRYFLRHDSEMTDSMIDAFLATGKSEDEHHWVRMAVRR